MNILMTSDTVGGVWTYTVDLCEALQAHKVTIELATMGAALSERQRTQLAKLPNVHLHESEYRLCWMPDSSADVEAAGRWLMQLAHELKPDLVHLNDLAHGGLPWPCPVLLVGHSCVLSWWLAVKKEAAPMPEWAEYKTLVTESVRQASLLVAPTQAMLHSLLYHYGPTERTRVIYNGTDRPALAETAENGEREPFIFAAGRVWDEAKNIDALTAIAAELPCPIYVAGETTAPDGTERSTESVTFLGQLAPDELHHWLARASLYVAPAAYEPFGLAALEAARAGCPLVLGDIKSLREVWGDAAVYVDPSDLAALRDKLINLITRPKRRHYLATAAWTRAKRYTSAAMAKSYLQCYQSLLGPRQVKHPVKKVRHSATS
ncbi:glycosyltransferase family 4 protein [Allohahella sp. A8]|uniref:glycosyltransferase family 4 protein n=1 Tax=Allohahella sp. A8 TaxID=3141461 RepID=UPI003A812BC8